MTTTPQAALLSDDEMRTVDLPTVVIDCLAAPHNLTYVNIGFQDRLHRFAIDVMEETLARVTRDDVLRWCPDLAKLQATQETDALIVKGALSGIVDSQINDLYPSRALRAEPVQAGELPDEREAFIHWMTTTYPDVYTQDKAEHYWVHEHVSRLAWQAATARAALSARKPLSEDLYCRLHTLSKILESSGRIDEQETRDAYPTILDAMNFVRGIGLEVKHG